MKLWSNVDELRVYDNHVTFTFSFPVPRFPFRVNSIIRILFLSLCTLCENLGKYILITLQRLLANLLPLVSMSLENDLP
jgi:hypothetical protein